jgi:regulator of protease activity HflC (stomatin/prohibitin superfamily)
MQYREKIIELISSGDDRAFNTWILQQPLILQPDILREFKELMTELIEENGANIPEELFEQLDAATDTYEESILDEQVALLKVEVARAERDKLVAQMDEARQGIRDYIKECIETNAPNAEAMKGLARQIIELEKKDDLYNPENWNWFEV